MGAVDPYEDALVLLKGTDKKTGKPNPLIESAKRAAGAAGQFAAGTAKGFVQELPNVGMGLLDMARQALTPPTPEALARAGINQAMSSAQSIGPQPVEGERLLPLGRGAPSTVSEAEQGASPAFEVGNIAMFGLPGIVGSAVGNPLGQRVNLQPMPGPMLPGQDRPVQSTPLPFGPEARGQALGGPLAQGLPFYGAPLVKGVGARFRPKAPAVMPLPETRVPADYEIVGDQPPKGLPEGAKPAPPPDQPLLPQGHRGLTAEKVEPGFTPIRSTYRVWIGAKPQATGPGGKAAKPEFRQYKEFTAFSREDAIAKAQDALGAARARVLEFKADEVKGSGKELSGAEQKGEPSVTAHEKHAEKAVGAIRAKLQRDEAIQAATPKAARKEGVIALPETSAELTQPVEAEAPAPKTRKAAAPKEAPEPSAPLRAEAVPKGPSPSEAVAAVEEKPIGGKSKVIREPTPQEALELAPGEQKVVGPHEKIVRINTETERRLTERRGAGGGATSFGEERGPEAPERRAPEARGRRAEDREEFTTAAKLGRSRLAEIRNAKTHDALLAIYRKHNPGVEPKAGIDTRTLRNELIGEAAALVKGSTQAGRGYPKARAAAQAAPRNRELPEYITENRGRWFTESARKAGGYGHRQYFVDVPETWTPDYGGNEYVLPKEFVDRIRPLSEAGPIEPGHKRLFRGEGRDEPPPEQVGRSASVKTPSREFPVRYEEVALSDLRPSNNPATFEPHPEYPFEQQRDYRTNKIEQDKVIRMARRFNPDYILADTPTSTDGPPIVSREGYVLGGNARTMALLRGIEEGTISKAELETAVAGAREKFGIKGGSQTGTIIVRRLTEDAPLEQLAKDTKALNEDFKMAVDPVSDAVARARNLSPDTVDWISGALQDAGPDATVRAAIFDDSQNLARLLERLAQDQVVVSSELPRLLDPSTSRLTPEGIRLIESALIGRVIRSPKMIREMSPALKNVVLGAISPLIRGETFPADWRVNNDVVNGLWLHHMAAKAGKTIEMMLEPQIIPEAFLDAVKENRVAVSIAKWFDENKGKSTSLRAALNRYNAHAEESVSGQELLGFLEPAKLPHEALNDAFGLKLSPDDFGTGDGLVYMHAGLPLKALEPMWKNVSERARQLKDWLFIPKDVREPWKPGEPFDEWWKRGRLPRTGDSFRTQFRQTWEKFAKAMILNWETRRYPYFHEQIDQYRVDAMAAMERATNLVAEVVHPIVYGRHAETGVFKRKPDALIAAQADLLNYIIGVSDLWGRSKEGKLTPANGFPDWAALPREEVTRLLDAELKASLLKAGPAVRLAHQNWIKLMTLMGDELEKRGALKAGGKRDWTYAPNIIDSYDWGQMADVAMLAKRVGEPARGYVKRALGHLSKHDPNMIRAGLKHTYSVLMDNLSSDFAHSVGRDWDYGPKIWDRVEKMAKEQGRTVEAVAKEIKVPDGYTAYRVGLTRRFWDPATDVEYALQRVVTEDPDFGIRFENLWQIREYAGATPGSGKARSVYIIPEPIAARLNQFREARSPLAQLEFQLGRGMAAWKALTLTSVYMSYRLQNIAGDVANVVTRTPGKFPLLPGLTILAKKAPKAFVEMVRAYTKGETTESLQRTDAAGGRQNVRAIAEIGDLRAHKDLRPFFEPQRAGVLRPVSKLWSLANDALGGWMIVDAILEGTLRHATIDYLGEKGFPLKRAERFASEVIGDYRNTDPFTARMRRNGVFPFMVWIRQMIPGWIRWFTGAKLGKHFEGPGGDATAPPNVPRPSAEPPKGTDPVLWKMVHSGRYPTGSLMALVLGVGLPMAMLNYWNSVLNADLDKKVPEFIRRGRTYMILPWWKTTDGRPLLWHVQSPIDAVTGFFGLGNPLERAARMKKAVDSGDPKVVAKATFDQMWESVGAVAQGTGDLAGPPVDVLRSFIETGFQMRKEMNRPEGKRDIPKVVKRNLKKLFGETVPFSKLAMREARTDLEGLPGWVPGQLRGTPWGSVLYVPPKQKEKKLKPVGAGMTSGLQPVGAAP